MAVQGRLAASTSRPEPPCGLWLVPAQACTPWHGPLAACGGKQGCAERALRVWDADAGERARVQAVLVNSGWEAEGADAAARLARVSLPRLVPAGFVFVWARKQHVAALVRQLYRWGYCYVENLTWVQLAANNTVLTLPAPYAQRSHLTLLIFRKDGARRRRPCSAASGWLTGHLACFQNIIIIIMIDAARACEEREPPARAQARARTSSCGTSATRTSSSTACGRAAVRLPAPGHQEVLLLRQASRAHTHCSSPTC